MKVRLAILTVAAMGTIAISSNGCGGECEYDGDCGGFGAQCYFGFCEYADPVDLTVKCRASGEMCHAYEPGCTIPRDDELGCPQPKGRHGDTCRTTEECAEGYTCYLNTPLEGDCISDLFSSTPSSP